MRDFRDVVRTHVAPLALPADREQKIVDEWSAQLEEIYDALRADGLSDLEAWSELQRQVGDWSALSDQLLDSEPMLLRLANAQRGPLVRGSLRAAVKRMRETLTVGAVRDVHASVRLLVKNPGFSATVILTLAICLGANAAIFTVVHAVLLRPLPVPEPDRIVGLGDVYPTITPNDILSNDVPSYFDRLEALTTLEEQGMFTLWFDTLTIGGVPQELRGMRVTPSLFRVLRVSPALGRAFTDAEGEIGEEQKVILSYSLWQRLYGGDPNVVGQSLRLAWTGNRYTIVGVMPREFSFFDQGYDGHAAPSHGVQFWIPLAFTPEQKSDSARARYGFFHLGRLRPGVAVEQVQAQLDALHAANVKRFPQLRFTELGMYSAVTPLQEALTRRVRRTLHLLWAGAGFVLLIGAINLANLSLARASVRRRELATRLALGAARLQVARQLMIEAMVPAALGGAASVAVGAAILRALVFTGLANLPHAVDVRMNATALGFVAGVSVVVGLMIGLVAATTAGAVTINQVLGDGNRSGTSGRTARLFRRALVVTQVGLSVVLLIGATLLFTSFRYLLNLDAGFTATGVVTATIFPPPSRYPNLRAVATLQDRVLQRVRTIPGVEAAGITSNIALSGFESPAAVSAAGRVAADEAAVVPSVVAVTPGYFEAMTTPVVRGRYFAEGDRDNTLRVAIVDERLAVRLWPGEDPIGKGIYRGDSGPFTVVGVVREVRLEGLTGSIASIGTAYFPHTQEPPLRRLRWIAIKSAVDPAAVVRALRAALLEIDPDLPIADIQTMSERAAHTLVSQRLATSLATMFAGVALLLSVLGLYGVLVSLVARRTREIGIRMALGSSARGVLQLVLAEGMVLIGVGLMLGLAGAIAMARTLKGMVFGVQPTDPVLLGTVAVAAGGVALLACIAPARRATRVNPVEVLSQH
ncbi:MAG: ABC transporter permease [Vicinamibacterales bacterium]